MGIEAEVAKRVYRYIELHEKEFSLGQAAEMNSMISEQFEGWLFRPSVGHMERYDAAALRAGNEKAADYYKGKPVRFRLSGLQILPQGDDQAAASYEVIHQHGETLVRALALEVWRREADGEWRLIRWFEEKGAPNR